MPRPCAAVIALLGLSGVVAPAAESLVGDDLSGWTCDLEHSTVPLEEVWSVDEGVLRCTGAPAGVLRTVRDDYENYTMRLEWRWPETPGNNGVLIHTSDPRVLGIWPRSLEVQLQHGAAGDFWVIGTEIDVEDEANLVRGRRHRRFREVEEKPAGEWNKMEIVSDNGTVTVRVNGDEVNRGENSTSRRGAICLQSEGAPIEYRNVTIEETD